MQTEKHNLKRFAAIMFVAFSAIASGCKEDSVSIPKHLVGSEWQGKGYASGEWSEDGSEEPVTLKFTSASECTYIVTDTDGSTVEYEYTYSYNKPELKLTPADENRKTLTGELTADDVAVSMWLYSAPERVAFHAFIGKYFEWQ